MSIVNPVLRGFNPDPSLCRVGDTYYIATSTFEWYPGVRIYRSDDLVNWSFAAHPLNTPELLDMRGVPDSGGIWAPSLSHADGKFWLIFTNVKRMANGYLDAPNYLTTATDITGPWSDPVYLNSSGFDPSLFHDDDGRKWLVNLLWNHRVRVGARASGGAFGGILLQEYDAQEKRLTGPVRKIFTGTDLGSTEGPHLMKRNGYYYLITAEGGTSYDHAVTHARSRTIEGPYEVHPNKHVLTTKDAPDSLLQRVGHGQPCDGPEPGTMLHSFLCGRPLSGRKTILGRETGIAILEWRDDDWLYLRGGGQVPPVEIPARESATYDVDETTDFEPGPLPPQFQWLRTPEPDNIFSLTERPGWLRLHAGQSIGSWFEQALVARRQTEHVCSVEVEMAFEPTTFQQQAGLVSYYNRNQFHYAYVTMGDDGQYRLTLQHRADGVKDGPLGYPIGHGVPVESGHIFLKLEIDFDRLQFSYRSSWDAEWMPLGPVLDASILSDEGKGDQYNQFTGNFVGVAAQDLSGAGLPADFRAFRYCATPSYPTPLAKQTEPSQEKGI